MLLSISRFKKSDPISLLMLPSAISGPLQQPLKICSWESGDPQEKRKMREGLQGEGAIIMV